MERNDLVDQYNEGSDHLAITLLNNLLQSSMLPYFVVLLEPKQFLLDLGEPSTLFLALFPGKDKFVQFEEHVTNQNSLLIPQWHLRYRSRSEERRVGTECRSVR